MIKPRTWARRLAMQFCFTCDLTDEWQTFSLREFLREHCDNDATRDFAEHLVNTVITRREEIDRQITTTTRHWELKRLAAVERNVLRVAMAELLTGDLDKKIIISEAVKIAQCFGNENSGKFVNGILDALAKGIIAPPIIE